MPSAALERRRRHRDQIRRSTTLLDQARRQFTKKHKYSSLVTRQTLRDQFSLRTNGQEAYDWQIDVSEALLLSLDCTVIAGTGAGKTMPFVMPLFVEPKKVVLVISPLNALEEDQASRFRDMQLSAVAVNGETYSSELHRDLENMKYQVILSSPEMCLKHSEFRKLLSSAKFSKVICSIVVDEAHCITQWGPSFRPEYADLGDIRAFAPHAPVLITSATLTASSLDHARKIMQVDASSSYHVMLGIDRPNIAWSVRNMVRGKDFESLRFIIPPANINSSMPAPLISTMVFFDDISLAMDAMVFLRQLLPQSDHKKVAIYNSRRTPRAKKKVMERFRNQEIKILLTTEAAGMGCDIPHIARVVQFTVPKSLDVWMQRGGRAGRDKSMRAEAILLVQPSVFQEVASKKGDTPPEEKGDPPEATQYRKEIDEGLRQWIGAIVCRRDIADEYYDSGVPRSAPLGVCCDNCQRVADNSQNLKEDHNEVDSDAGLEKGGLSQSESEDDEPVAVCNDAPPSKRRDPSILPQKRRGAHLADAQKSMERWRSETWRQYYFRRPWGNEVILPTRVISNLANKTHVQTIDDLIEVGGWSCHRALRHGEELLSVLQKVDDRERLRRIAEKQKKEDERQERKRVADAAKEAKKAETKRRREEERMNCPKKPRPSRAKRQKLGGNVAADIPDGKENVAPLSAPGPLSVPQWPQAPPFTPPRPAANAQQFHFASTPPPNSNYYKRMNYHSGVPMTPVLPSYVAIGPHVPPYQHSGSPGSVSAYCQPPGPPQYLQPQPPPTYDPLQSLEMRSVLHHYTWPQY